MKCENCGAEHNGEYSNRFCSKHCARAYSTKHVNRDNVRTVNCCICGKEITIKATSPIKNRKCNDCKRRHKYCTICGRPKNPITNKCTNSFCNEHNNQHFVSLIKYFGFDKSKYGTVDVEDEFNRIKDILYDLYWNKHKSSTEIAKQFNYTSNPTNITQKIFKQILHIPVKTCKQSTQENFIENRINLGEANNQYVHGWHITWNNKEVYYRSQYELDYANELDSKQIDYEMETLRIKYFDSQTNEFRCAIPDFYIPSENMIVEIKSSYTLDVQNMKDKFIEYRNKGYNCKCICDKKEIQL